jgi:GNAT superfamily N-acetyltransferase
MNTHAKSAEPEGHPNRMRDIPAGVVVAKLRRRLWSAHRAVVVSRDLQDEPSLPVDGIRVELVAPDAFDELPVLVERAVGVEYLYLRPIERARQARAGTLSVARAADGHLVAFHFVHESGDHAALDSVAPGMYPLLPEDGVLTEEVYCLPAYRGRGLAPALLQATGAMLLERGKRRASAYLDTTNIAALRMFNRAGYRPTGGERVDRYRGGHFDTVFRTMTPPTLAEWEAAIGGSREQAAG